MQANIVLRKTRLIEQLNGRSELTRLRFESSCHIKIEIEGIPSKHANLFINNIYAIV